MLRTDAEGFPIKNYCSSVTCHNHLQSSIIIRHSVRHKRIWTFTPRMTSIILDHTSVYWDIRVKANQYTYTGSNCN